MTDSPIGLPPKPTMIVGGYGYRNAGDEAILAGLLTLTGRDGVTVVSRAPAETAAIHRVRSISIATAPLAMLRHRGLVIGGGGLFGRDMGLLGRLLPLAGIIAASAGKGVSIIGIGADREMPASGRWLLGALGRRAICTVVRDDDSRAVLRSLGIHATVAGDLSSRVASAGREAGLRRLEAAGFKPRRRPVVGLCITAIDLELATHVVDALVAAVDALPGADFCVLPMSQHPFVDTHNDAILAHRLVAMRSRVQIVHPPDDTAELLGLFDAFSAAVCMRYHSLLFAERGGIPIVPIAYAEKCRHWLADRGMTSIQPTPAAVIAGLRAVLAVAA